MTIKSQHDLGRAHSKLVKSILFLFINNELLKIEFKRNWTFKKAAPLVTAPNTMKNDRQTAKQTRLENSEIDTYIHCGKVQRSLI
jgi:hypothetical protein